MHKRQRKVLNPAFATGYIRDIVPIFSEKAADLVDTLLEKLKSQSAEGIEMFSLFESHNLGHNRFCWYYPFAIKR